MTKDEALRLAIESLCCVRDMVGHPDNLEYIDHQVAKIEAALEAKHEPVAWRDAAIRLGEELSSVGPDGYYDMDAKEWLDWAMEQNPRGEHSLPQRTWVGLTDEEINAAASCQSWKPFAKAIEAKLKEKNT